MTAPTIALDARMASALPELGIPFEAAENPAPALVALNGALADDLGLDRDFLTSADGVAFLTGRAVPAGAQPVAMGYAGHQFGNYSPRLGDGRAMLLGELTTPAGATVDIHLKGSGRTPYSRGGDGRATLSSMLREFVMSEAMHALGVPTTRSLAVVTTGEPVPRQRLEPGAILVRTASSHLRVGTFQFARWLDDPAVLPRLVDFAIDRHCPERAGADRPALELLDHTVDAQARLIAQWMSIGFIHGVMNTDNCTISGETIDFGPCAFMDRFDPATVYSSIDQQGRYAYGNQPAIGQWNLARLAEALLTLIDDDRDTAVALATERLERFVLVYQEAWTGFMAAKLGVAADTPGVGDVAEGLVALQTVAGADHTGTYRALAASLRGDDAPLRAMFPDHGAELDAWLATWHGIGANHAEVADRMDAVNPVVVPRNHLVEEALDASVEGDLVPFEKLLARVTAPFTLPAGDERYAEPAPASFDDGHMTFCGT